LPHLFGKDEMAYWRSYDWKRSLTAGMNYMGLPFSGDYGFVETEYYFQITHQVAPEEDVLSCENCHSRNGRLANITGVYMPGRDFSGILEVIGWLAVAGALAGVLFHGGLRLFTRRSRNKE
ncbi:MAG: cytochrome C, partial [Desulfarculaceae bacterium]